jgi:hypothetical protein
MSRVTVMSAIAYDLESYEETGVPDPVIRVLGELPGGSRPFGISRVYKGSQGMYEEVLALADPDGVILWESEPRVIQLRGMMYEDLFRRVVRDRIEVASTREHTLVMYLNGRITGRIPVFIDAPDSVQGAGVFLDAAQTALKKGSICWLTIPQKGRKPVTRPAWYVQQGTSLFVLKGDTEQELPGLESASTVTLTVKSKDVKAMLGSVEADVRVVSDDEEFERIASMGLGTRLNLTDGDRALQRWKDNCTLVELTPRA